MVSIAQVKQNINKDSLKWLKRKGIEPPENSKSVEYILVPKFQEYIEMFTFRDRQDLRLVQQKNYINKTTNEKTVQIREYDYTKRFDGKGKISEIRQKTITPTGEKTKANWRFYYAKDGFPPRFSHKNNEGEINNYLQADGYITDKNGLKIRPISTAEYLDKSKDLDDKHYIDSPWTLKQSITTKERCGTDSVQECTVVGIYGEKGLSLNHLNPNNIDNQNFEQIEDALYTQLEQQGKNAKAFILGACESDQESLRQYNQIDDFLTVNKVPHSSFKTGDDVLYGAFKFASKVKYNEAKKFKYGQASPFEWQSGQHMIYENGEIQLANSIIDSELKKGNTDPESLIRKSFSKIKDI